MIPDILEKTPIMISLRNESRVSAILTENESHVFSTESNYAPKSGSIPSTARSALCESNHTVVLRKGRIGHASKESRDNAADTVRRKTSLQTLIERLRVHADSGDFEDCRNITDGLDCCNQVRNEERNYGGTI
jgi:hypothetical protein